MAASLQRLLRATMELLKLSVWKYILMPLEALFVTEKTLSSALDQLDANTMPLNNNDKMPDLEVTGMSDDQLTIQLSNTAAPEKPHRSKKYSESSDDIEVVHSGDLPNLQGILKGRNRTASDSSDVLKGHIRTVSESSDGDEVFGVRGSYRREDSVSSILSTGSASEGPVSESEEGHRKKSVSFSEYVDSTTYKANASVSTLHASLKKKSKRYRKKEAKIERRRRRSSGSEHEHSSEEQSSQPETSESVGEVDDDDSDVVIDHQQVAAGEEGAPKADPELPEGPKADPHDEEEDSLNVVAAKQSKKSKKNKKKGKGKKSGLSETSAASHTPPETRGESVTSEEGESCVEVVTPQDGERTKGVNGEKVNGVKVNGEKVNGVKVNGAGGTEAQAQGDDCDSDDTEHGPAAAGGERTKKRAVEAPDSVLSWDNAKPTGEAEDVTKCAFNFNNSMMYDLDDD